METAFEAIAPVDSDIGYLPAETELKTVIQPPLRLRLAESRSDIGDMIAALDEGWIKKSRR